MRKTLTGAVVGSLIILGSIVSVLYVLDNAGTIEVQNPVQTATSTVEVETDNVSEAQKQLNEAKRLLDEEEKTKLAEIAEIEANAAATIAEIEAKKESDISEREARLEEIRAVRLSFSQAPAQAE